MNKTGNKTLEKCEIICPFCFSNTKRWKLIPIIKKTIIVVEYSKDTTTEKIISNSIKKKIVDAVDEVGTMKWEREVLQEHLANCSAKDYVSFSVLEHYGLTK